MDDSFVTKMSREKLHLREMFKRNILYMDLFDSKNSNLPCLGIFKEYSFCIAHEISRISLDRVGGDKYRHWSPGARNTILVNSWVMTKSGGYNNWRSKGVILIQYILSVTFAHWFNQVIQQMFANQGF